MLVRCYNPSAGRKAIKESQEKKFTPKLMIKIVEINKMSITDLAFYERTFMYGGDFVT